MINYTKHYIDQKDIKQVVVSLKSNFISQGKFLKKLEQNIQSKFGCKYALAVSSGSAALHLAYKALGLNHNDYILTSTLTWVSTIDAALNCNADFDLLDIDRSTFNVDVNKLKSYLERKTIKPKIFVPVHYAGLPCQMEEIHKICKKYNIKIVEDAAQGMGSKINKNFVGNCSYSDVTIFSLQPTKSITSGEGGIILTNNKKIYQKAKMLRRHGAQKNLKYPWSEEITMLGYNYKIAEPNCALALSQLKKINKFIKLREKKFKLYQLMLTSVSKSILFQKIDYHLKSSYHLMVIKFKKNLSLKKKKLIFNYFARNKINLTLKYLPIHMNKIFKNKFKNGNFENSENFFKNSFCFPLYFSLTDKDIIKIVNCLKIIIKKYKL